MESAARPPDSPLRYLVVDMYGAMCHKAFFSVASEWRSIIVEVCCWHAHKRWLMRIVVPGAGLVLDRDGVLGEMGSAIRDQHVRGEFLSAVACSHGRQGS